jgi:predicted O-methyltransferase YrrM
MSSFRSVRIGHSPELPGRDQNHNGNGAKPPERSAPNSEERGSAPSRVEARLDAACIRRRIEQIYARQSILDDAGVNRAILPIAVTPERGAFIADLCRAERPAATLEVGMAWGLSTLHILAALAEVHGGAGFKPHVVMDPFEASRFGNAALRVIRELGAERMIEFYSEPSEIVLPRLLADLRQFDLAFIDGDHRFDPGFVDLFFIHRLLKPGGVVIFDDVSFDGIYLTSRWAETNLGYELVAQYPMPDRRVPRKASDLARARIAAWRKPLQEVRRDRFHFVPFFEEFAARREAPNSAARRAERNQLCHAGLMALKAGDRQRARALFAEARRLDPFHLSTYLRWMRCFLPARAAAMLTGRTRT